MRASFIETNVSVLFNEPKLLKFAEAVAWGSDECVSVLFNEPKLLKSSPRETKARLLVRFSTLQRAEIAEIGRVGSPPLERHRFSTLQRAEIAEIFFLKPYTSRLPGFSTLQRAEIAEIFCNATLHR